MTTSPEPHDAGRRTRSDDPDAVGAEVIEVDASDRDPVLVAHTTSIDHKIWNVRLVVMVALAAAITAITITLLVGVLGGALTTDEAKDVALIVLTPLFTLLGTAVGFVFDSKAR